jgi:bifunctional ADP-heptose synthase (sugar kinase/adenylyltransferase)
VSKPRILVIGEKAEDLWTYGEVTRKNPESPSLIICPTESTYVNPGMADNTVSNLKSLSPNHEVVFYSNQIPIKKERFVDSKSNYIMLRVDMNDKIRDDDRATVPRFHEFLQERRVKFNNLHAIVISDYGKGFTDTLFLQEVLDLAEKYHIPTFVDTKFVLDQWSQSAFCVKINELEYDVNLKAKIDKPPERFCKNLVVTMGKNGAYWVTQNRYFLPPKKVEIMDVVGAGDTTLAGIVSEYLETGDLSKAIKFGIAAATFAVTKRGVTVVKRSDLE